MSEHPTRDEIVRFLSSQTAQENRKVARHLFECAACSALALGALRSSAATAEGGRVLAYRAGAGGAGADADPLRLRLVAALRELAAAAPLMAELRTHPCDRWRLIVRNQERFRSLPVALGILDTIRELSFDQPRLGAQLAELALALLDRLSPATYGRRLLDDVRARAWGEIARSHRLAGDYTGSEEAFRRAGELLAGSADPVELGGHLHRLASLRKDQRRFDEARALLGRAVDLYEDAGDRRLAVRALTTLGNLHIDEGSPGEALPPLLEAVERVDAEDDPRTALFARHNLALAFAELGEHAEASRLFAACRDAYERLGDAHTLLRARWLEGIIAAGSGEEGRAEELLRGVRSLLAADGQDYDAALASLDLAMLLAAQGRSGELRELAEEMAATFLGHDVHREAAAALGFFRQAVAQQRATAELAAAVGRYLKRARHRPDLRFVAGA